jgi:hypothetical protein
LRLSPEHDAPGWVVSSDGLSRARPQRANELGVL